MIKPTFLQVKENAHCMTTDNYMEYCDTIDDISDANHSIFDNKPCNVIRLEKFFWPECLRLETHNVYGFKEPGAYIETYDIFAVNRKTGIAWAIYVTDEFNEYTAESLNFRTFLLPHEKLKPIYDALLEIMTSLNSSNESCDNSNDNSSDH
jgi:hypothetical protein